MATNTGPKPNVTTVTRKKLQFRDTRLGVLPNTIDAFSRLTVDAATKAALTSAGAKLTVEIDTAGTRVFLADQRTGVLIGGPEDLSRLGGIRSFVSRERKDAQGIEVAREVTQLAYKAKSHLVLNNPAYKQVSLESSYGAAVRPLLATLDRIDENRKKLKENTNPELSSIFKPELENMFTKIRNAYFHLILLHTKGENTKGKLQELLYERGVPEYVHTRLTNQGLVLDRGQELARVLFPSDPSKGMSLTLKEWRQSLFRSKLGNSLLGGSHLAMKLTNDDSFIRAITKIDGSVDLKDETNPSVAKLLKCRVAVMPPMRDDRYVIEPASKTKAGWKFPSPGMDSIQGAMNALSVSLLRMYSANMQSVDLVGDFYATIVPGAVSRAAVTPTNNFYVQWGNAKNHNDIWLDHVLGGSTGEYRVNVWRWLRTEMRLSENAEGGKTLAKALLLKENGTPLPNKTREIEISKPDPKDDKKTIIVKETQEYYPGFTDPSNRPRAYSLLKDETELNLTRHLTDEEQPIWKKFQKETFPVKKTGKKSRVVTGNTLTKLTPAGVALAEEIESISPHLAERMRTWLRGFSDMRIQSAAVKLANASFDELFIQESQDSGEDGGESDDSDAEEE